MGLENYTAQYNTEYEKDYFTKTGYEGYFDYPLNIVRVNKIVSMSNPKSVLDVGCAYGYIIKRLLEKGIPAMGMDISHWCEDKAQDIIPGHFVRHDLTQVPYPFKDKEFDVLYCEGVLEHVPESTVESVMKEFERISNKRILALTFDWHVQQRPHLSEDGLAPGHICLKSHNWWFRMMPDHTWLFYPATGIQDGKLWFYKC